MSHIILSALGICCPLGDTKQQVWQNAIAGNKVGMHWRSDLHSEQQAIVVGEVQAQLPDTTSWPTSYRTRNNQLAAHAYQQIAADVEQLQQQYGAHRIAVIIGTSTSGIAEGEQAVHHLKAAAHLSADAYTGAEKQPDYHYESQQMSAPADFIAWLAGVEGPRYAISTACSSSARALISARNLLLADVADAVIVGGVDSLCHLTINGFSALESISAGFCQPFSANRDGINIGEGAALFIMCKQAQGISLVGAGASSDAHHMSAPHPEGVGAMQAITQACNQAKITPQQLDYINLHGTATPLNDRMESTALASLGLSQVAASSSKSLTGHTLGAAGAIEAALCWLTLSDYNSGHHLVPHSLDQKIDNSLAPLNFVKLGQQLQVRYCLSNSFAFGGNNVALILGKIS
jgi:3-oxoacyl-[acyl-carrier-protein] synthase I